MKRIFLSFYALVFLVLQEATAQNVGIGTPTPNSSALLDLVAANKGILVPRISIGNALFASPVNTPATGLLVWNTNSSITNGSGTGFYFWSGSQWVKIGAETDGWRLEGNSAIDTALHFIGTTNNAALMFRTFGQPSGGIFPLGDNLTLGFRAGPLLRFDGGNFTGERNTFLGADAGRNETSGRYNTFIGARSGFGSNGSFGNTMVGAQAGTSITSGNHNTGIGIGAGSISTGNRNVSIGANAGGFFTGDNNIGIGFDVASFVQGGNGNVLIGSYAATGNFGLFPKMDSYDNVIIGDSAVHKLNGATANVIIGKRSGLNSANAKFNVFVGDSTGLNNGIGQQNTFIGSKARGATPTLSNATAIGANALAGANNVLILGGINGLNGATADVNVGIGTSTPARRLHVVNGNSTGVNSSSNSTLVLDRSGGANYLSMLIDNDREGALIFGKVGSNQPPFDGGIFYNTGGSGAMQFRNKGGLTRMIIHDNGNISMGSSSNVHKLLIQNGDATGISASVNSSVVIDKAGGANYISVLGDNTNETGLLFGREGASAAFANGAIIFNNPATPGGLQFRTGGNSTKMVINDLGQVGVGSNNPQYRLHVVTADAQNFGYREGIVVENIADGVGNTGEAAISFKNRGDAGTGTRQWMVGLNQNRNLAFAYGDDFAGGSITKMLIDSTGNVGMGTTAPSEKLHVVGNILATGTVSPSDIRFKKNIIPMASLLAQVIALEPMRYEWKKDEFPEYGFGDEKTIGVMAQQLEQFFPELVVTGKNGYKAVDYSKLSVVLLKALQEQQELIVQQQSTLQDVLKRLELVEAGSNRRGE